MSASQKDLAATRLSPFKQVTRALPTEIVAVDGHPSIAQRKARLARLHQAHFKLGTHAASFGKKL